MALTDYIGRHSPRLLIHGHQHVNRETRVGGTRVVGVFGSMVMKVGTCFGGFHAGELSRRWERMDHTRSGKGC
jgi:hypothetical protein